MAVTGYPDFLRVEEGPQLPVVEVVSNSMQVGSTTLGPFYVGNATALTVMFVPNQESFIRLQWNSGGTFNNQLFQEEWHVRGAQTANFTTGIMGRFVTAIVQNNVAAGVFNLTLTPTTTAAYMGGWNPGIPLVTAINNGVGVGADAFINLDRPYRGLAALTGLASQVPARIYLRSRSAGGVFANIGGLTLLTANSFETTLVYVPPLICEAAVGNLAAAASNMQVSVVPQPMA